MDLITAATNAIQQGGIVFLLVAAVVALGMGWVVTRSANDKEVGLWKDRYEEEVTDAMEWKDLAKSSVAANERLAAALEVQNRLFGTGK